MNNYRNQGPSWQTPDYSYGGPTPGPYTPPTPPPPAPKKMPRWAKIVAVVVAVPVVLVGGCTAIVAGSGLANQAADPRPVPGSNTYDPGINTPEAKPSKAPKPVEEAPTLLPTDGTLLVGKDVKPGTYQTRVTDDEVPSCYWARLANLDGALGSIIDNDITITANALVTLRVRSTDYAVEINCDGAVWTRVGQ